MKPKRNIPPSILEKFPDMGLASRPIFSLEQRKELSILSKYKGMGLHMNNPFFSSVNE